MSGVRVFLDFRVRTGGAGRYGHELVAGLRALGVDVIVFTAGRPFTPWGRVRAGRAAARAGAELLHGLHVEAPRSRLPIVVTIHDVIPLDHPASMPSAWRRLEYGRVLDLTLRRAARIVVPSEATAAALRRRGADAAKLAVVPLGVAACFRPSTEDERAEARERFAGGRRYVAAPTGARAHKNLAGVAGAAAIVDRDLGVAVRSPGRAPAGAGGSIGFADQLSDRELSRFYGGAEVLLLASHLEGFGLPAAEALACGTPVICGPGLGALPYVRPGVVVVDVGSPGAIAAAVRRILESEEFRRVLSAAGREAVSALSPERMAHETLSVYADVLDRR